MAATSESVLDIAGMTAIFSVLIPIGTKWLFTIGAYKLIISFTVHLIKIAVPPLISAFIRAEPLLLPSSRLGVFKGGSFEHPLEKWHLQA